MWYWPKEVLLKQSFNVMELSRRRVLSLGNKAVVEIECLLDFVSRAISCWWTLRPQKSNHRRKKF